LYTNARMQSQPRVTQRAPKSCTECTRRRIKCTKDVPCRPCIARGQRAECRREVVLLRRQLEGLTSSSSTTQHKSPETERGNRQDHVSKNKSHRRNSEGKSVIAKFSANRQQATSSASATLENGWKMQHLLGDGSSSFLSTGYVESTSTGKMKVLKYQAST